MDGDSGGGQLVVRGLPEVAEELTKVEAETGEEHQQSELDALRVAEGLVHTQTYAALLDSVHVPFRGTGLWTECWGSGKKPGPPA